MILIDSNTFDTITIAIGTFLFIALLVWAFWFASKMD